MRPVRGTLRSEDESVNHTWDVSVDVRWYDTVPSDFSTRRRELGYCAVLDIQPCYRRHNASSSESFTPQADTVSCAAR
jgi:hypothetical protein